MRATDNVVHVWHDPAAQRIGQTYRKGVEAYQETGRLLIAQKDKMNHGEWLPWLKANETVLGFGVTTAGRLMRWAEEPNLSPSEIWQSGDHPNSSLATNLPDSSPSPQRKSETRDWPGERYVRGKRVVT